MISLRKIFHKHKLLLRLLSMTFTLVIVTLSIMFLILTRTSKKTIMDSQGDMLLKVGHEIAADPFVQSSAENTHFSQQIVDYAGAEEARFGLDYVVIMTKDSTRLTHPNHHLIGSPFQGEQDQYDALNGESYIRMGQGPMGRSMRAFVPIYNSDNQVVGAVALGIMLPKLNLLFEQARRTVSLSVMIAFLVVGIMAIWLAYSLKNRMLGMEPEEIAQVVEERNAMFNYTDMAILITVQRSASS
ncbi:sensor histidine kinase [Aerococcus urinae]